MMYMEGRMCLSHMWRSEGKFMTSALLVSLHGLPGLHIGTFNPSLRSGLHGRHLYLPPPLPAPDTLLPFLVLFWRQDFKQPRLASNFLGY